MQRLYFKHHVKKLVKNYLTKKDQDNGTGGIPFKHINMIAKIDTRKTEVK